MSTTSDIAARDWQMLRLQEKLLEQIAAGKLSPAEADAELRSFVMDAQARKVPEA